MPNKDTVPVISCMVGVYWTLGTSKTDAGVASSTYKLLALGGWLVDGWKGWDRCWGMGTGWGDMAEGSRMKI